METNKQIALVNAALANFDSELDKEVTSVYFVLIDKQVTAIFPFLGWTNFDLSVSSYDHFGQHSPCSLDWITQGKEATYEEYKDLKEELENYPEPYILTVLNTEVQDET